MPLCIVLVLAGCQRAGPPPPAPPPAAGADIRAMEARNYVEFFATHDTAGWEVAKQRLVKLGTPAIPVLFAAMQERPGAVAFNCQDVLKRMGPEALPPLVEEIRKGDAGYTDRALDKRRLFRGQLIAVVGEMRAPGSAAALTDILREDRWATARRKAAFYLGELKDPKAVPILIEILRKDASEDVRGMALGALKRLAERDLGPNPEVWEAWWKERQAGS
jgi:hypothetical protein